MIESNRNRSLDEDKSKSTVAQLLFFAKTFKLRVRNLTCSPVRNPCYKNEDKKKIK